MIVLGITVFIVLAGIAGTSLHQLLRKKKTKEMTRENWINGWINYQDKYYALQKFYPIDREPNIIGEFPTYNMVDNAPQTIEETVKRLLEEENYEELAKLKKEGKI